MSPLNRNMIVVLLIAAGLLLVGGCGSSSPNGNAVFSDQAGHPADWLPAGHMNAAQANETVCTQCHGDDFSGGIANVSCTLCHLGGVNSEHPISWGTGSQIGLNHAPYAQTNGTTACAETYCHGNTLTGVAESGPSCSSCHLGGPTQVHDASFSQNTGTTHAPYAVANGTTACSNEVCHGTTLTGVQGSGPSCTSCHLGSPTSVHPTNWGAAILSMHGPYVAVNDTDACSNINCHGANLEGVAGSGPSCRSCHSFP
jgi:hypothetical protein